MRTRLTSLLAATAIAMTGLISLSQPPAHASTNPRILLGILDHWEDDVAADETQLGFTGKFHFGFVGTFFTWSTVKPSSGVNWANWVRNRGGAPMLALQPPGTATLSQIAAGQQDSYLKSWATALRDWGHPFMLRLFPEMNGSWETYAPGTRGQTPAQFVSAWQHIYTLFHQQGASNVHFIWNPDRYFKGEAYSYAQLWPGSSYVNYLGLDAYNWADSTHGTYWPYYLVYDSAKMARALPGASARPLVIPEIGTAQYSSKPAWINRLADDMQRIGARAVLYFNENPGPNWRLDSSSASLSAAKTAFHAGNVMYYGRVSESSIDSFISTGRVPWT